MLEKFDFFPPPSNFYDRYTNNKVCFHQLSVDHHKLLVISADGYDVQPLEVDVVNMQPGLGLR